MLYISTYNLDSSIGELLLTGTNYTSWWLLQLKFYFELKLSSFLWNSDTMISSKNVADITGDLLCFESSIRSFHGPTIRSMVGNASTGLRKNKYSEHNNWYIFILNNNLCNVYVLKLKYFLGDDPLFLVPGGHSTPFGPSCCKHCPSPLFPKPYFRSLFGVKIFVVYQNQFQFCSKTFTKRPETGKNGH